jgi:hypothetical protein
MDDQKTLIEFCMRQRDSFSADEWVAAARMGDTKHKIRIGLAAYVLSRVPWFGHSGDLISISHRLLGKKKDDLAELSKEAQFEPGVFLASISSRKP